MYGIMVLVLKTNVSRLAGTVRMLLGSFGLRAEVKEEAQIDGCKVLCSVAVKYSWN